MGTRAAGRSFTSCLRETERKTPSCDVIKGSTLPLSQDSAPDHTSIKLVALNAVFIIAEVFILTISHTKTQMHSQVFFSQWTTMDYFLV